MFRGGNVTEMLVNTSESLFADKILIMALILNIDPELERSCKCSF